MLGIPIDECLLSLFISFPWLFFHTFCHLATSMDKKSKLLDDKNCQNQMPTSPFLRLAFLFNLTNYSRTIAKSISRMSKASNIFYLSTKCKCKCNILSLSTKWKPMSCIENGFLLMPSHLHILLAYSETRFWQWLISTCWGERSSSSWVISSPLSAWLSSSNTSESMFIVIILIGDTLLVSWLHHLTCFALLD